ncbi:MAG: hypothetical protein HYX78_12855 [Armatimonadetes bacterium]|nr:hypothetical protein [Armatimonadota bacterium]
MSTGTKYYYDAVNRLYKTTNPDNTYSKTWFDANGNVMSVKDENGATDSVKAVEYRYDNLGRVKQEKRYAQRDSSTSDTAVTIDYCYDEVGALKWTKWKRDNVEKTISYSYDERNRLIQETHPTGSKPGWLKYKYDGNGTGGAIQGRYFYENTAPGGDLEYLTSPDGPPGTGAGPVSRYDYGAYGLLSTVYYDTRTGTYPYHPCLRTNYTYDHDSTGYPQDYYSKKRLWLRRLENFRSDGSVISSFDYLYDYVGNRTQITEESGDYTTYDYDRSHRLRKEERKDSANQTIYLYDYEYDEIGNRKLKKLANNLGVNCRFQ